LGKRIHEHPIRSGDLKRKSSGVPLTRQTGTRGASPVQWWGGSKQAEKSGLVVRNSLSGQKKKKKKPKTNTNKKRAKGSKFTGRKKKRLPDDNIENVGRRRIVRRGKAGGDERGG